MKRKGDWMQKLAEGLDLPAEPIPGLPLVEIAGEQRVLVENHSGVCQYSTERICVRVKYGMISIQGRGLELSRMSREQLIISGKIDCVMLSRRNRP